MPILALQDHVKLAQVLVWEVDEKAAAVAMEQIHGIITNRGQPRAHHRGDWASLAAEIRRIDPKGKLRIMIAAGAPCPDYSRITDPDPRGIQNLEPPFCIDLDPLLFSWTRPAQLDPPQCFLVGSTTFFVW